ncbi:MAG: GPW/gp25 family protein [Nocardioides sp.]|jgi:Bacteriophage baseplate protein W
MTVRPMWPDHPLHVDARGRTAETGAEDHVRDLVEQVLFTAPGERVNRPEFGCGLLQLVFAPNSEALAATVELTAQAALRQWLSTVMEVVAVEIEHDEATLRVVVRYTLLRTGESVEAAFERGLP